MSEKRLNEQNYTQGFLIDEHLMAGVTDAPEDPGQFLAFVLNHGTGEYLGYQIYSNLSSALGAINQIPRSWAFESSSGCGEGGCGKGGKCAGEACKKRKAGTCSLGHC